MAAHFADGEQTLTSTEGASSTQRSFSRLLAELAAGPHHEQWIAWEHGFRPGDVVADRFELVRLLARGGFGVVFKARDRKLNRLVAFKAIRPGGQSDELVLREAEVAAQLQHDNLVRLYDYGSCDSGAFLVFELLAGETLDARLRRGPIPVREALHIAAEVTRALVYAHARGVLHRDLKPANILLTEECQVKVLDFGIAYYFGEGPARSGTPGYMAPEQTRGGPEDARTDIFAVGVLLGEMVSGKKASLESSTSGRGQSATRHSKDGGLPPILADLVARATHPDPSRRPPDAVHLRGELDAVQRSLAELKRPTRRWLRLIAAGLALALLLAAFAFARYSPTPWPQEPQPRAMPGPPRRVVAILGFRDELASHEMAWLPTAVSQLLSDEFEAAETSLRVVPEDRVAEVRRSLGVPENAVDDEKVRERMQGLLAANVLIYGVLKPMTHGSASLGLFVKMVDAVTGRELAALEEDLGEGAEAMPDKVSKIAELLRRALGAFLSQQEASALSVSRERSGAALRAYAEGVMSLRNYDFVRAKSHFDAALAMDSSFLDARRRVVEFWEHEGNRNKARDAAEQIHSHPLGLTPRKAAELDAELLSLGPEHAKGTEALRALFDSTPDDIELGLRLVEKDLRPWLAPERVRAIISRLRALPAPASDDIRLWLAEANAAWRVGNRTEAEDLLARANARAQAIGARTEMAQVLTERAFALWQVEGRTADALPPLQEAAAILSDEGELQQLADVKLLQEMLMESLSSTSTALKLLEENAALDRRLGDRFSLRFTLVREAQMMFASGDLERSARKLHEALDESEAIGRPLGQQYTMVKGWLALADADLEEVRKTVRELRTQGATEDYALGLEANAFREQDRFQEARETLEKMKAVFETNGRGLAASDTQGDLCKLSCDAGHPQQGLACLARKPPADGMDIAARVNGSLRLAICRYLAGDLEGAEHAGADASAEARRCGWYFERVLADAYLMRARAARGEAEKARTSLRAELAEAERRRARGMAFEVALALGEVELRAGRPEGSRRLLKLEQEATSRQHFRLARLAREAFDGKPAAPTPAK